MAMLRASRKWSYQWNRLVGVRRFLMMPGGDAGMINLRKDGSIPSKRRGSTATGPAGFLRFARKRGSILLQQVGRYDSGGAK